MRIDGIFLPDVPVLSAALSDDLVLVVQRSGLLVQSYQNLTSTYYAIAGEIKIPGINLPTVRIATSQPTDELVLIVENSGLAVKQIGFNAPVMSDGSKIAVPGIGIPSVRFSGTIDGDEYVLAVRANNLCLIPIPSSFSAGALPTAGQTFYASLKTSLAPEVGTGGPTWSRATAAWRFNDLGYLRQIPSGCAEFGGARLVTNQVGASEAVNGSAWTKSNCTAGSATTLVCASGTSLQRMYSAAAYAFAVGEKWDFCARLTYVDHPYVQIRGHGSISNGVANFDILNGTYTIAGDADSASMTLVSAGVYDCRVRISVTGAATSAVPAFSFVSSTAAAMNATFAGDGVKSFGITRIQSVNVTGRDASYIPEYVSVGVLSSPYHGAGADGSKYFTTDSQGAPIPVANLTRLRKESAATNALLWSRDLAGQTWTESGGNFTPSAWITSVTGSNLVTNGDFASNLSGWTGNGTSTNTWSGGGANLDGTGGTGGIYQTLTTTIGKIYLVTVSITIISGSSNATVSIKGATVDSTMIKYDGTVSNKSVSIIFKATLTNHVLYIATASGKISQVDDVVVKECTCIPERIATGLDGIANTATTLTATSADAIILQPITLASAARCASAYVRRKTGTGTISFTQDGGSTWTDITSQLNSTTFSRVQITATLANPSVGFKIATSGDAIEVDCVQNEAGAVATSPIVTTTATVTRNADSLTDQTSGNWSDTAGTAYILAKPVVYSGGAVGSATNGLLLSASNSGATAYDGTNSANGPTGTPGAVEKLALAWGSSTMSVASSGLVGTPGTYDGAMGLSSIGVGVGAVGYFGDVAIYNYKMTDAELQAITT